MVSSVLISNLPLHFPEIPHWYFKGRLEELSTIMDDVFNGNGDDSLDKDDMDLDGKGKMLHGNSAMDIDECYLRGKFAENNKLVKSIGMVARYLGSLGFTSTTENTYASAILLLLKAVLHALLAYHGDTASYNILSPRLRSPLATYPSACYPGINAPSEGLVRWQLRLEYFACDTLRKI